MDFNKVINKRTSIRKYASRKVAAEHVIECIQAANLAPSPGNLSLLTFVVVEEQELKDKLASACQQDFIKDASYLVVVCSNNHQSNIMYDERGEKYLKQHAGAVIENFLLKITDLGLASCWIGAFSDEMVKRILRIPDEFQVEAILPVAFESKLSKTKQRTKSSLENRIYFNEWRNKFSKKYIDIKSSYE